LQKEASAPAAGLPHDGDDGGPVHIPEADNSHAKWLLTAPSVVKTTASDRVATVASQR